MPSSGSCWPSMVIVPRLDGLQPVDGPAQRRLARPGRTEHDDDLALADRQIDVLQHVQVTEVLVDVAEHDQRLPELVRGDRRSVGGVVQVDPAPPLPPWADPRRIMRQRWEADVEIRLLPRPTAEDSVSVRRRCSPRVAALRPRRCPTRTTQDLTGGARMIMPSCVGPGLKASGPQVIGSTATDQSRSVLPVNTWTQSRSRRPRARRSARRRSAGPPTAVGVAGQLGHRRVRIGVLPATSAGAQVLGARPPARIRSSGSSRSSTSR